jgi:hypothetical protein
MVGSGGNNLVSPIKWSQTSNAPRFRDDLS